MLRFCLLSLRRYTCKCTKPRENALLGPTYKPDASKLVMTQKLIGTALEVKLQHHAANYYFQFAQYMPRMQ